jgi:hypothetical protein
VAQITITWEAVVPYLRELVEDDERYLDMVPALNTVLFREHANIGHPIVLDDARLIYAVEVPRLFPGMAQLLVSFVIQEDDGGSIKIRIVDMWTM